LLDDLLDISRIASGKITLRISRTSLATAVSSAIEASRPHLDALGQTLELRMPGESIDVDGDLGRLAQVFANLINNASKFSDRGSRIAIHIEREMHTAVVRVIDSGVGIAADQLPRIFEMFTQLGEPRGRTSGGLGVGLWLARELCRVCA